MHTAVVQPACFSVLMESELQLGLGELRKTEVPSHSPQGLSGKSRYTLHQAVELLNFEKGECLDFLSVFLRNIFDGVDL